MHPIKMECIRTFLLFHCASFFAFSSDFLLFSVISFFILFLYPPQNGLNTRCPMWISTGWISWHPGNWRGNWNNTCRDGNSIWQEPGSDHSRRPFLLRLAAGAPAIWPSLRGAGGRVRQAVAGCARYRLQNHFERTGMLVRRSSSGYSEGILLGFQAGRCRFGIRVVDGGDQVFAGERVQRFQPGHRYQYERGLRGDLRDYPGGVGAIFCRTGDPVGAVRGV